MINPENTFSTADTAALIERGYCVGYDLDGNPERAMACHPTTGFIVRSFWSGFSLWHPALNRQAEMVFHRRNTDMATGLKCEGELKRHNVYSSWRNRSSNYERLANLRNLAAAGNNETISLENV